MTTKPITCYDPDHEGHSPKHHTGKPCIEPGCAEPAGTAWSPLWCVAHNMERMRRIDAAFDKLRNRTNNNPHAWGYE